MKRLTAFDLPKGEKFLYLDKQFNTERYWKALARDLDETKSVYGAAFHSLLARGGMVPKASFDIISGAPTKQKGQVPSVVVLQRMQKARLVFAASRRRSNAGATSVRATSRPKS